MASCLQAKASLADAWRTNQGDQANLRIQYVLTKEGKFLFTSNKRSDRCRQIRTRPRNVQLPRINLRSFLHENTQITARETLKLQLFTRRDIQYLRKLMDYLYGGTAFLRFHLAQHDRRAIQLLRKFFLCKPKGFAAALQPFSKR